MKTPTETHNEESIWEVWLQQCYIKRFNEFCGKNMTLSNSAATLFRSLAHYMRCTGT